MPFKVDELPEAPYSFQLVVNKTGSWRNFRPVIDYNRCIRCMICWKFCPDLSIQIVPDETHKLKIKPVIDYEHCKGCGICANECPVKCIEMVREE
ncbi:MAG: 4Fe-4S binding protein [Candidatus Asgardarchaeia archaeon]